MRSWINVRNGERLGVCPAWTQPLCGHQPSRITPILHPVIASSVHDSDPWLLVSPGSSHFSQTHQQTHPFWELPAASASADLGTLWTNSHLFMTSCHWPSDPRLKTQLPMPALTQPGKYQTSSFSNKPSLSKGSDETRKSSLCADWLVRHGENKPRWSRVYQLRLMSHRAQTQPPWLNRTLLCSLTVAKMAVMNSLTSLQWPFKRLFQK